MVLSSRHRFSRSTRAVLATGLVCLAAAAASAQPTTIAPYPNIGMAGMAVANNRIYYGTGVFAQEFCTAYKHVFSLSTTGTPAAALLDSTAPGGCSGGLMLANIVPSGAYIYMAMGNQVQRVYALGGDVTETVIPVTTTTPSALAVDQFRVYVESPNDVLTAYPRDGGPAVGSISVPGLLGGFNNTFTAPGDGFVYFIANGNIFRWNGTSGSTQTIENTATIANIIWVDSTDVWWVAAGTSQTIRRVPVTGGTSVIRHTALSGTDIFAMTGDATNIYFMADPSGAGQDVIRRLPRTSTTATDVNDVSAGNNTRILCQDDQFLYWAEFGGATPGIRKNFKNATITRPDIFLAQDRLEVIQSVQDNVNSVELVGNRPTMVRVYPQASQFLSNVGCQLEGTTPSGTPLPGSPIRATKLTTNLFSAAPDRGEFSKSFNFILPDSWVALGSGNSTSIRLRATLDPANFIAESNEINNSTSQQTFTFRKTDTLMIDCRRVLTVTDYTMDSFNFGQIVQKAHQILPFSKIVLREVPGRLEEWEPTFTDPGRHGPWELNGKQWSCAWICNEDDFVNTLLGIEWLLSEIPNALNGFPVRLHRMGMISPISDWDWGGLAPTFANNSMVKMSGSVFFRSLNDPYGGTSMAHELSHNFGFEHVNCGSGFRGGFDENYPYQPCEVGPTNTGPGRSIAFDWIRKELHDAPNFRSYMSYEDPGWTEPYHWNTIYNSVVLRGGAPMPASPEALMVIGVYDPVSGAATVHSVRRFDRTGLPAENIDKMWNQQSQAASIRSIPLNVELLNSLDQPIDAVVIHVARPCCALHTGLRPFQAIAPAASAVRGVRVSPQTAADGSPTAGAIFRASAGAPTITVNSPALGTNFSAAQNITVTWSASDPNGDPLTAVIQYSPDAGVTWTAVASIGNTGTHTFTPADRLAGSASTAGNGSSLFRVTVSDGFNTAAAVSPAFKVANRPPIIQLVSPVNGSSHAAGEQILFEAIASDPEDFNLNFYTWSRVRSGVTTAMGVTSEPRLLLANGLPPGTYTINCTITDAGFQADTASITIVVGGSFESAAPDADGDGIPDSTDKCPAVASANNADTDGDGVGDVCDKCPTLFTLTQIDRDGDGIGDACDPCPDGLISEIGVDGAAEPAYGPALAVQNTATSAGDSVTGDANNSTGSELSNIHAFTDCDRLFIHIAGNLAIGTGDSIDVFIDSVIGGQNRLRAGNPAGLVALSEATGGVGLTFESGFTADHWIGLTNTWQTLNVAAAVSGVYAPLIASGANPAQTNLGQAAAFGDGTFSGGTANTLGIKATLDNSNRVGVIAGTGAGNGSNAIAGLELSIPLATLGNPNCDIRVFVLLRDGPGGAGGDLLTNQTLPGIGGGAPLGAARTVNFNSIAGTQFGTITRPIVGAAAADLEPTSIGRRFTVSAPVYAPAPFTIQWRRDGVNVTDNGRISGATTPLLTIDPARNQDLGAYTAAVTTACGTVISPAAALSFCFADYNESGGVSVQDIFDFLAGFFAGDMRADFNGSGTLSVQDIFDFLAAFFAGCA